MLSSGKIVSDYRPLLEYWKLAKAHKPSLADKIIVDRKDLELIKSLSLQKRKVTEILEVLRGKILDRIDGNLAKKAIKNVYNLDISEENAKMVIAKILAGWYIEVADNLNVVKIKKDITSSSSR